jgi:cysteine synthase B
MLVSTKDRPACARLRKEAQQMSYPTIESTIGNTPLIQLPRIAAKSQRRNNIILGKLKATTRPVRQGPCRLFMITRAEARGRSSPATP